MTQYALYFLAAALLGLTAYFYSVDGGGDRVFVTAVFACAAFFVGYRFRLRGRVPERQPAEPSE